MTTGRIAAPRMVDSMVFARRRQCAPHLLHISLSTRSESQTAFRSVQPFLHKSRQTVLILYARPPFTLKIAPSRGDLTPSNTWFIGPIRSHNPNSISIDSAVFAQLTAECPYILYNGPPLLPSKLTFRPCLLWPNGWMDQDDTWHDGKRRPGQYCVRCGPSSIHKGHSLPKFRPMSVAAKRMDGSRFHLVQS